MKKLFPIIASFLLLSPSFAQSANDLFQQALVMERSEGNLTEANALYEKVIETGTDRALSAKALIRIGDNYERLGLQLAQHAYQRVLDDYSEQRDTAQIARDRLSILTARATEDPQHEMSDSIVKKHVMDIPDGMGEVSPDGRFLSFVEWNSANVGFIDLDTGKQTLVNSEGYWGDTNSAFGDKSIWSSDGKKLMYQWLSDDMTETRIYDMETGETRVFLPQSGEHPFPVRWSNDGSRVLAINELSNHVTDAITFVDIDSGESTVVTTLSDNLHTFEMDLSPDEKHIVFESFETGQRNNRNSPIALKLQSSDGKSQVTLVDDGYRNYSPIWNKGGDHVVYMSLRGEKTELWAVEVKNGKPAGQPTFLSASFEGNVFPEGMTEDGRYFYSQAIREMFVYERGVDFETGAMHNNLRVISSEQYGSQRSGAISPSGDYLAFVSEQPGESMLVITELDSGESKLFDFTDRGRIQLPPTSAVTWSTDGKFVLVGSRQIDHPRNPIILSVNVQEGSFTILEGFDAYNVFALNSIKGAGYSQEGDNVVLATTNHIVEIDQISGDQRVVHEFADRNIIASSLSPDGKTIAVSVQPSSDESAHNATIELITVSDGRISKIDEASTGMGYSGWVGLSWTPDGNRLVFGENRPNSGQQLYALEVNSGQRTALGGEVFDTDQYAGVRVHPDGDKLTFTQGAEKLQLWVLEGLDF